MYIVYTFGCICDSPRTSKNLPSLLDPASTLKKKIQHPHYLPAFPSFPAFSTAAGFSCSPNNKNLPLQVASLSLGIQRAGCNHCSNAWLTKRPTMWSHVWKFGENRGLEIAAIGRFFGLTFWAKRKKIIKLGIVGADLRDSQSIEFIPESSQWTEGLLQKEHNNLFNIRSIHFVDPYIFGHIWGH